MRPEQLLAAGKNAHAAEDYERAFGLYSQALELADVGKDDLCCIDISLALADLALYLCPPEADRFVLREKFCRRALDVSRSIEYQSGIAASLRRMATLDISSATTLLSESLSIATAIDDVDGIVKAKCLLAANRYLADDTEGAVTLAAEAVAAARSHGDPETLCHALDTLSLSLAGTREARIAIYAELVNLCRTQRWRRKLMRTLYYYAGVADASFKEGLLREALEIAQSCSDTDWESTCLESLSNVLRANDPAEADELMAMSRAIAGPQRDFPELGEALRNGDWAAAEKAIRTALGGPLS